MGRGVRTELLSPALFLNPSNSRELKSVIQVHIVLDVFWNKGAVSYRQRNSAKVTVMPLVGLAGFELANS